MRLSWVGDESSAIDSTLGTAQRLKPIPLRRYQAFALPIVGGGPALVGRKPRRAGNVAMFVGWSAPGLSRCRNGPLMRLSWVGDESSAVDSTLGTVTTAQADPAETVSGFRPTDHW
jgi:hypothetical protein